MSENTLKRLEQVRRQFNVKGSERLKDKVCIVTGVGSLKGIGRATAIAFARENAKALYLLDYDETNLPDLEATIRKLAPDCKVSARQGDAGDEETIEGLCNKAIEEYGRLDVFFANAGIAAANVLQNIDFEDFQEILRVNTLSCFLALKHASEAMKHNSMDKESLGGSIIMTASVAGLRSGAGGLDYSASKAAVISLAQTGSWQLTGTNIRVNAILPGLIQTGMTEPTFEYSKERGTMSKIGQLNPAKRYGIAEEIANAVLFLASDEASYVNGTALAVDGGLSASHPVVPGRMA